MRYGFPPIGGSAVKGRVCVALRRECVTIAADRRVIDDTPFSTRFPPTCRPTAHPDKIPRVRGEEEADKLRQEALDEQTPDVMETLHHGLFEAAAVPALQQKCHRWL
jgi:hypothetical protein